MELIYVKKYEMRDIMEGWVLAVGYDLNKFNEIQIEWLKYGLFIRMVKSLQEAIEELMNNKKYLIVVISSNQDDYFSSLKIIRKLTKVPIHMTTYQYDSGKKITAIDSKAAEYIQYTDTIYESSVSARTLICRYIKHNQFNNISVKILLSGSVFISMDYRKVFVDTHEIKLSYRELDLFYILASAPDRVYTYEQLLKRVWGSKYTPTDNYLHSCIHRIQKKLEIFPESSCYIKNICGIGYSLKRK